MEKEVKEALDALDAAVAQLEAAIGDSLPWLRHAVTDAKADVEGILAKEGCVAEAAAAAMTDIAKLRELLAKATPGPWAHQSGHIMPLVNSFDWICNCQISNQPNWQYNAALIVALRNNAEVLLDAAERAERMEAALHEAEEALDGYSDVRDGDYGVPEPNRAMRALSEIRAVLEAK